jgi:hypothetical protein
MSETATTPRCPYTRSFRYIDGQYHITIGWAELTEIIDMLDDVWVFAEEATHGNDKLGEMFAALTDHIDGLREWTGWGGVPGKYLTAPAEVTA